MEFLENLDREYYIFGYLIIIIIGQLIVQRKNSLRLTLQYRLWAYVIAMMLISLSIPHVFPWHPHDIENMADRSRLLYYMRDNNETMVHVTRAFNYMFYASLIFAFSIVMPIIKHFKIDKSVE